MKSEPSRELLGKVMTVADTKIELPLQERDFLNRWGVFCNRKHRLFGTLLYVAGGQFDIKLDFIRKRDGSIQVNKYIPGDWEFALEHTYNYAKYIVESQIDEREKAEFMQLSTKAKNQEETIHLLEQRASHNPAWLFYLMAACTAAGRFKDAEQALIKFVERWPIFYAYINLGTFYLQALANEKGINLSAQIADKEWADLSLHDLGYNYDNALGLAKHELQEALRLAPQNDPSMQGRLKAALAELSALEKQHS